MKLIWMGHGSFRIEVEDQVFLLDPWLSGNPMLDEKFHDDLIEGITGILITHGHFDHTADCLALAQKHQVPLIGMYELMRYWEATEDVETVAFNFGGTVHQGKVTITMVSALHSSSLPTEDGPKFVGPENGFIIHGDGRTLYFSGDTDVHMDMDLIADRYKPDVGILSAGGHFTMDMEGAAYAAKRFFDFKTVIPCHYKTFPFLEQSARSLVDALPDVNVIEPVVMDPIDL